MVDSQDKKLAKRLARLVIEAGEAGISELKPALEKILSGRSARDRKVFLKAFHKAAEQEIMKATLTIESATPLSEDVLKQIVESFSKTGERPLQVIQKSNPNLIAGVRAQLGDMVYDASLVNSLQSLATRVR